ncbi:MAG: chalcone isomerase [Crocinitomix sp.]|nr:chalcone isomerase [Crocinitomix sp.]
MKIVAMIVAMLALTPAMAQTKISGNIMPNVMKVGGEYLKMNGGGIREKMFFDLYVGVLYLQEKTTDADAIINGDKPMAIKIKIISGMVDNENFQEALEEGFEKSTGGNVAPYRDRMDQMMDVGFADDIKTNDVYDIVYQPGIGCTLYKNDNSLVTVTGLDFKKALFGVWLCDDPADAGLKKKMLGK